MPTPGTCTSFHSSRAESKATKIVKFAQKATIKLILLLGFMGKRSYNLFSCQERSFTYHMVRFFKIFFLKKLTIIMFFFFFLSSYATHNLQYWWQCCSDWELPVCWCSPRPHCRQTFSFLKKNLFFIFNVFVITFHEFLAIAADQISRHIPKWNESQAFRYDEVWHILVL